MTTPIEIEQKERDRESAYLVLRTSLKDRDEPAFHPWDEAQTHRP